ncbi:MAG: hypothetical protein R6U28_11035 [Cyclonatronaceae bacterium]
MMPKSSTSRIDFRKTTGRRIINLPVIAGHAAIFLLLLTPLSCSSEVNTQAEQPGPSTHTPATPPTDEPVRTAPVYVESAAPASDTTGRYIRISGHLPTPCHHLAPPKQEADRDTLRIELNSWQKTDAMCSQVLEPFVYYMKIAPPDEPLPAYLFINDERAGW